jgi:hypothetical protein
MRQRRLMSAVEAAAYVVVGYWIAVALQILLFPAFGIVTTRLDNLALGAVFTAASLMRSYALRRLFAGLDP